MIMIKKIILNIELFSSGLVSFFETSLVKIIPKDAKYVDVAAIIILMDKVCIEYSPSFK